MKVAIFSYLVILSDHSLSRDVAIISGRKCKSRVSGFCAIGFLFYMVIVFLVIMSVYKAFVIALRFSMMKAWVDPPF